MKNYKEIFDTIVKQTAKYITDNNLKAMVLGISGGIDSTVVAAICYEVSILTGVPLIGRSLPTKYNKKDEVSTARLVGNAFCNSFTEVPIKSIYDTFQTVVMTNEGTSTPLSRGNIQARLRMIYLYNLAGIMRGLVMDTDNLTENNLGYFTIHGDVGDFNPIGGLWKTEVFELAQWLLSHYSFQIPHNMYEATSEQLEKAGKIFQQGKAIKESLKLKPTAGLGITSNDLEELGAESYEQVDEILKSIIIYRDNFYGTTKDDYVNHIIKCDVFPNIPKEVINNIATKHFISDFKRNPVKVISNEYIV